MSIRRARQDEAGVLTAVARASKAHWGYSVAVLDGWNTELTVTEDYLASHQVYVLVDGGAIAGFYALRQLAPGLLELDHMWVRPQRIGHGLGRQLLQHAAATARDRGALALQIDSDPHAEEFYLRAGARRSAAVPAPIDGEPDRILPRLILDL